MDVKPDTSNISTLPEIDPERLPSDKLSEIRRGTRFSTFFLPALETSYNIEI